MSAVAERHAEQDSNVLTAARLTARVEVLGFEC